MEKTISIPDRLAGMIIGVALLIAGAGFIVLGVTFLPVAGIFMGIAVLRLAWHFMAPKAILSEPVAAAAGPEGWDHLAKTAGAAA